MSHLLFNEPGLRLYNISLNNIFDLKRGKYNHVTEWVTSLITKSQQTVQTIGILLKARSDPTMTVVADEFHKFTDLPYTIGKIKMVYSIVERT